MNNDLIYKEMEKRGEIINTFDKNYLLEAGAGAGKTTIIVERIINHIVNSEINPSNLVAITFTKAAATELAERIQIKALERLKKENNPRIRERLKDVDKIFTGTIHSFCDLILREMPFHANLSPGYEIIEDAEEFHRNIWYNFLRDKEDDYREKMELLYKLNINYMSLRPKVLLALENSDVEFIGYENVDCSYEDLEKQFEEIKEKYGELEYKDISRSKAIGKLLYGILEDKGSLEDYLNIFNNAFLDKTFDLEEYFSSIHKKSSVFQEEGRYKDFIEELYNLYTKLQAIPYNTCTEFINMVVNYKRENYKGSLTFNELLYKASNLVKTSEEARVHLKNKYKYFYLDESQDTDPMQIELIMHLVDKDNKYKGFKSWRDVEPMPGSLFIVGDPKQSIYRFRRADIAIYNQLKEVIDKNGEVVYLDINFRSSERICNWIQSAFKNESDESFGFCKEATDAQAGFDKILSHWDDSLGEDEAQDNAPYIQGVYKYIYGENDEEYVADLILQLLDKYMIVEKTNEDAKYYNRSRKVKLKDIMILTKANEETGLYLRSLKDRGIPALLAGEKNLGDTREVLNLFALIDALVDYRDNIKIVSALRNSFYLDLETIQLFMEEEKNFSKFMFSHEGTNKIEHLNIKKAFTYINEIMSLSKELSPIAFVENLVENRLGIYDVNKDYDALELRDANSSLRQVIEILKTKECYSIYCLREEIKLLISNKVQYELPINKDEATNALRIMNIHKAKGLEANIVILVGGDKKRYAFPDTHYVERDSKDKSIGYMRYSSSLKAKGPNEEAKKDRESTFKEAEMDRLLYVAATRAQSALIVANGIEEKSFLYPLSTNINREIVVDEETERKNNTLKLSKNKEMERKLTKELRIKKEIYPPTYILTSPSNFKGGLFNGRDKEGSMIKSLKLKSAKKVTPTDKIRFDYGPRGKNYGTIVHRALELLILGTDNLKDIDKDKIIYAANLAIDGVVDNLEVNKTNIGLFYPGQSIKVEKIIDLNIKKGREKAVNVIKNRLYGYIVDVLENFIKNENIKEIFHNADMIFTEMPFTIGIDKSNKDLFDEVLSFMDNREVDNNKTILINGVIDLVIKSKDDIWTIIDYKTDRPLMVNQDLPNYLRMAYGNQLKGYSLLFEEVLKEKGIKVDNLLLYSTYMDKIVDMQGQLAVNSE